MVREAALGVYNQRDVCPHRSAFHHTPMLKSMRSLHGLINQFMNGMCGERHHVRRNVDMRNNAGNDEVSWLIILVKNRRRVLRVALNNMNLAHSLR